MILVDVSSILHRMVFGSTKDSSNFTIVDGKYRTEDFIKLTLHYIISEIIENQLKYRNYGEIVLCFDDYKKTYWRRDVYPNYKLNRRVASTENTNPVNYQEVFAYTNELFEQFKENTPWKCVYVNRAEADDIILILAKEFYQEGVLILSPDKDFLQAQRLPGIKQYSSLTKKWIIPEDKHENMDKWIFKHCMLGDVSDNVPKVIDETEFSEEFKKHLTELKKPTEVIEFKKLPIDEKRDVLSKYKVHTYNRKGQETGLDIYEVKGFGESHLDKIINGEWKKKQIVDELKNKKKELTQTIKLTADKDKRKELRAKSKLLTEEIKAVEPVITDKNLDEFLDSHPLYREHYERNFTLVMEEGIPDYIRKNVLMEYNDAKSDYNEDEFCKYLTDLGLHSIIPKLSLVFNSNVQIDVTNCGWDFWVNHSLKEIHENINFNKWFTKIW